jgi:hypothetical protein
MLLIPGQVRVQGLLLALHLFHRLARVLEEGELGHHGLERRTLGGRQRLRRRQPAQEFGREGR